MLRDVAHPRAVLSRVTNPPRRFSEQAWSSSDGIQREQALDEARDLGGRVVLEHAEVDEHLDHGLARPVVRAAQDAGVEDLERREGPGGARGLRRSPGLRGSARFRGVLRLRGGLGLCAGSGLRGRGRLRGCIRRRRAARGARLRGRRAVRAVSGRLPRRRDLRQSRLPCPSAQPAFRRLRTVGLSDQGSCATEPVGRGPRCRRPAREVPRADHGAQEKASKWPGVPG